jgi:hypothetical protein
LIGTSQDPKQHSIDGKENNKITLDIPENIKNTFDLEFSVDDSRIRLTELNEETIQVLKYFFQGFLNQPST